jgi:hypothetical protein
MVKNGSALPSGGLTVTTNKMVFVQGDYNLSEEPAAILGDSLQLLSNSWDGTAWAPDGSTAKQSASDTTYKFAYMTGLGGFTALELPLIEDWTGDDLTKVTSAVFMWRSREFPPKAGIYTFKSNWHKLAYRAFYSPAEWDNIMSSVFGANPPPGVDTEWVPYVKILSIDEVEINEE